MLSSWMTKRAERCILGSCGHSSGTCLQGRSDNRYNVSKQLAYLMDPRILRQYLLFVFDSTDKQLKYADEEPPGLAEGHCQARLEGTRRRRSRGGHGSLDNPPEVEVEELVRGRDSKDPRHTAVAVAVVVDLDHMEDAGGHHSNHLAGRGEDMPTSVDPIGVGEEVDSRLADQLIADLVVDSHLLRWGRHIAGRWDNRAKMRREAHRAAEAHGWRVR